MLTTTTTACTSSKYTILPHQANSGNWSLRNNTHCRRKLPKLIKTLHPWKTSLRNFHTAYTIFLSSLTLSKHSSPRLWRLANNSCCSAATRKDNQVRFSYRTKPVPLEEINGGATLALKHRRDWGLKAGGSPAATGACRHTLARRHRPGNRWAGPAAAEEHPHLTACALSNAPTAGGGDAGLAAQPSPAATLEGPNAAGQGERGGLAGGQSGGSSSSRRQPPLSDGPAAWPPPTHPAWPGLAPPRRARREEAGPPAPRRLPSHAARGTVTGGGSGPRAQPLRSAPRRGRCSAPPPRPRAPLPACFCFLPPSDTGGSGAADWLAAARRRSQSAGGDARGWGRAGFRPAGKGRGREGGGRNHLGGVGGEGPGRSHSCGEGSRRPVGWARGPRRRGPWGDVPLSGGCRPRPGRLGTATSAAFTGEVKEAPRCEREPERLLRAALPAAAAGSGSAPARSSPVLQALWRVSARLGCLAWGLKWSWLKLPA